MAVIPRGFIVATRRTHSVAWPLCQLVLQAPKPVDPAYPSELRTVGDHVRKRRLDLGLTKKGVSLLIGVDVSTVANWEAGRSTPRTGTLRGIARFLGPSGPAG